MKAGHLVRVSIAVIDAMTVKNLGQRRLTLLTLPQHSPLQKTV